MKTISLNIEGDYENGSFTMFSLNLKRNGFNLPILLTAKQTNLAIQYDDPFEPILELRNILLESGYSIAQHIEIINGDDSKDQMRFLKEFNTITEAWNKETQSINLTFSNGKNPDDSNIVLESIGAGYTFTIYTEANDETPTELMSILKSILLSD